MALHFLPKPYRNGCSAKVWKQTIIGFFVTNNRDTSCYLKIGKKWSAIYLVVFRILLVIFTLGLIESIFSGITLWHSTFYHNPTEIAVAQKFKNKPCLLFLWYFRILLVIFTLGLIESIFSGIDKKCTLNWEFCEIRINTSTMSWGPGNIQCRLLDADPYF